MTLNQALKIAKDPADRARPNKLHYLACGFEPLHLKTFVRAHLLERMPECNIEILNGIYGDLAGNLASAAESPAIGAALVLEWSDIDPRLGLRSSGGWGEEARPDILSSALQRYSHIETALAKLTGRMPVVLAPPCLPIVPLGNTIRAQASVVELELEDQLASFLVRVSRLPGLRIVQKSRLDRIPIEQRLDAQMELLAGFPYTVECADLLAGALTQVLYPPAPMKGLITDLDDTLWSGIAGEVGAEGVSWHQDSHTQTHGLYQQMLSHLAGCGVLLAVSSKNDLSIAEAALARKDLLLKPDSFFPVVADWAPKSQAVARILRTWNIGEESVVFVDDNPMELEEVKRAFPGITCRQFPQRNPGRVWQLLYELRDLFGKPRLTEEDRLRQASIRAAVQIEETGGAAGSPEFLQSLKATVTLDWRLDPSEKRPLDLINKTNQFNLNGRRLGEGEWQRHLEDRNTILGVVSYTDKFGPIGKAAVVLGTKNNGAVRVSHWVMSCRAFSRRLEHHTLAGLFHETNADEIEFAFEPTGKNKPLQEFFRSTGIGPDPKGTYRLSRAVFSAQGGVLPHQVLELTR